MTEKRKKSTKKELLWEALKLFSEKGYEAVSVAEIAQAVGVSAPALYKHYKSKQDLFEAILQESDAGYNERMEYLQMDFDKNPQLRAKYITLDEKEQIKGLQQIFLSTLHDEFPCAFRKLLSVEQFHMEQLAEIYNERYVESKFRGYEKLFEMLIREGVMRQSDPYAMAVQYISPVIVLIGVCDRAPDKEKWALETLEKHVKQFNKIYRIKP